MCPDRAYQPGACNIGSPEVRVRQLFFRFFLVFSLLLSVASLYWSQSMWIWGFMLFTVFSTWVLHFQIRYRFCILFGFFNLHNFRQLGHLTEVKNPEHARLDRKRVFEILIQSLAFALVYASIVHLIAVQLH